MQEEEKKDDDAVKPKCEHEWEIKIEGIIFKSKYAYCQKCLATRYWKGPVLTMSGTIIKDAHWGEIHL